MPIGASYERFPGTSRTFPVVPAIGYEGDQLGFQPSFFMENKVGDICLLLVQKFLSGIQSQISELNEGGSFVPVSARAPPELKGRSRTQQSIGLLPQA